MTKEQKRSSSKESDKINGFYLGEDSVGIVDFQEKGKGVTIDLEEMKECKVYWMMLYNQSWNFAKKDGKIQFWEPEAY